MPCLQLSSSATGHFVSLSSRVGVAADDVARNVNGKLVKKDLKPALVKEWNARNAKKTRSKL